MVMIFGRIERGTGKRSRTIESCDPIVRGWDFAGSPPFYENRSIWN